VTVRPEGGDPFGPIVREIQQGINVDRNFEELYKHFHPRLWRHFIRLGIRQAAAEDLCQEVLFKAFRSLGSFEGRSWFARWLFEIAHNLYVNELRRWDAEKRDGREVPLVEEHPRAKDDNRGRAQELVAPAPSPYDEVQLREEIAKLRAALKTLPPQMRRCVCLWVQGLKYREVAEAIKVSIDTVKAHLGQAKVRLRQLLSD